MLSICQLQVHDKSRLCMDLFTWHSMRVPDQTKSKNEKIYKRKGKQIQRKKNTGIKTEVKNIYCLERKREAKPVNKTWFLKRLHLFSNSRLWRLCLFSKAFV